MKSANDGLRFVVEMTVLVSLGFWGLHATDSGLRWPLIIAHRLPSPTAIGPLAAASPVTTTPT